MRGLRCRHSVRKPCCSMNPLSACRIKTISRFLHSLDLRRRISLRKRRLCLRCLRGLGCAFLRFHPWCCHCGLRGGLLPACRFFNGVTDLLHLIRRHIGFVFIKKAVQLYDRLVKRFRNHHAALGPDVLPFSVFLIRKSRLPDDAVLSCIRHIGQKLGQSQ